MLSSINHYARTMKERLQGIVVRVPCEQRCYKDASVSFIGQTPLLAGNANSQLDKTKIDTLTGVSNSTKLFSGVLTETYSKHYTSLGKGIKASFGIFGSFPFKIENTGAC